MNRFTKLVWCLSTPRYAGALIRRRVAAGVEHERVLFGLDCRTVIDVGANRGQFALVARHCFPNSRIYSFEPLSAPAARFRAVFADDPRVLLHESAIGPSRSEATIHISNRDDSSSLLPIGLMQRTLFPNTEEVGVAAIAVAPLHDLIGTQQIEGKALLKVDVQGYELKALQGCGPLLHLFAYVYCECSFVELYEGQALADEVIAWLHERNFKLRGVHNVTYDGTGRAIQADFLFSQQC